MPNGCEGRPGGAEGINNALLSINKIVAKPLQYLYPCWTRKGAMATAMSLRK